MEQPEEVSGEGRSSKHADVDIDVQGEIVIVLYISIPIRHHLYQCLAHEHTLLDFSHNVPSIVLAHDYDTSPTSSHSTGSS